ncbi:alpha-tubulin N-acetyltransferase 1 isoform X2 [Epargyreus clarus]|uniref:alpha-tubulin N-acetyltransferase 1 isoform X2 n=1 Tax=Epargyreus clarus TaxID=520877 RepID=UPI003C2C25C3
MDWMMPVNEMLKDDITKINYKLMPPHFKGDIQAIRVMQNSLTRLIDVIGEQSAAAQGLTRIITTADKLRNSPTHILYLLKDARAKGGKGDVVGLLKMGTKHLFLFNENDKVCEVEPLCILDFYVIKDRQRSGYGKLLFDYMLQDLQTTAKELAIDGPSPKMEQFLRKNYGVDVLMRQNNNFAVSPDFFKLVPYITNSGRCTPVVEPPPVGRFAAPKPQSSIATVIHGAGTYFEDASPRFNRSRAMNYH